MIFGWTRKIVVQTKQPLSYIWRLKRNKRSARSKKKINRAIKQTMLSLQKNTTTMWTIAGKTCVSVIRFNEAGDDTRGAFHKVLYSDKE